MTEQIKQIKQSFAQVELQPACLEEVRAEMERE